MADIEELNLEHGMPTAAEARARLLTELDVARRKGVRVLKLVHGYGSSGRGGKLRTSLRTLLRQQLEQRAISAFITGEAWSIFDADSRALLDRFPALRRDADLEKGNAGITFVVLSRG